jgi:DNA-binding transcriptional LysR family regulator
VARDGIELEPFWRREAALWPGADWRNPEPAFGQVPESSRGWDRFETNQLESIFQLVQAGFGITLVPAMASSGRAGCALIPVKGAPTRRVGYLRARRHVVTKPMRELTSWLRRAAEGTCPPGGNGPV